MELSNDVLSSLRAPFLAMAELKRVWFCSFGLRKRSIAVIISYLVSSLAEIRVLSQSTKSNISKKQPES
jgi:hypothetical protein